MTGYRYSAHMMNKNRRSGKDGNILNKQGNNLYLLVKRNGITVQVNDLRASSQKGET